MLESAIEKAVTKHAQGLNWLAYKFTSPSNRAVPDRIYLRDGVTIFVEFKQLGKLPTPLQERCHKDLRAQGFEVFVIDSVQAGKDLFNAKS